MNYEAIRTQVFEMMDKMEERGRTSEHITKFSLGMLKGIKIANVLSKEEYDKLHEEVLQRI